jgi:hypothetical protein
MKRAMKKNLGNALKETFNNSDPYLEDQQP